VKYTLDDVEVVADTYTVRVKVWINEPDDYAVPVEAISAANDRYPGYKLITDPFVAPETVMHGETITVPYEKTYTVTFLPGVHGRFVEGAVTEFFDLSFGVKTPEEPLLLAQFGWKFDGWSPVLSPTVTGNAVYEAQWVLVNPAQEFPDKIPSVQHYDKWWDEYDILCYAASTISNNDEGSYRVVLNEGFFDRFYSCTVGFGTKNNIEYELVLTSDGATLYKMLPSGERGDVITTREYSIETVTGSRHYGDKDPNFTFGENLLCLDFNNPFINGAKQAWLY
jgi:hypothetical protein